MSFVKIEDLYCEKQTDIKIHKIYGPNASFWMLKQLVCIAVSVLSMFNVFASMLILNSETEIQMCMCRNISHPLWAIHKNQRDWYTHFIPNYVTDKHIALELFKICNPFIANYFKALRLFLKGASICVRRGIAIHITRFKEPW